MRLDDDSVMIVKFTEEAMHEKNNRELFDMAEAGECEWKHVITSGMQWISITASMGNNNYELATKLFYDKS